MENLKISIIILNYNGLKYLKRTLLNVLKLVYQNKEIIVIDNGSIDGSIEFIKSFTEIRLIISPIQKLKNFACNFAIDQSHGDYILLLDNDALILDDKLLSKLLNRYKNNDNCGIIGLSFYDEFSKTSSSYGGYLSYHYVKVYKEISIEELKNYDNSEIAFPEGKGFFIKKSVWNECGGYDDHLIFGGDDTDIGMKTIMMGYKNYLFSETVQVHLGLEERLDNEKYAWKFTNIFYSHFYTMIKNYRMINLIPSIVIYSIWGIMKLGYQAVKRKHLGTFLAYIKGLIMLKKNIKIALKKRKEIQSKRLIKKDLYLTIRSKV